MAPPVPGHPTPDFLVPAVRNWRHNCLGRHNHPDPAGNLVIIPARAVRTMAQQSATNRHLRCETSQTVARVVHGAGIVLNRSRTRWNSWTGMAGWSWEVFRELKLQLTHSRVPVLVGRTTYGWWLIFWMMQTYGIRWINSSISEELWFWAHRSWMQKYEQSSGGDLVSSELPILGNNVMLAGKPRRTDHELLVRAVICQEHRALRTIPQYNRPLAS